LASLLVLPLAACLDAPFGQKSSASLSHQITRAVGDSLQSGPEATAPKEEDAGDDSGQTTGALALSIGEEIVVELGASLREAGLTQSQSDFIASQARAALQSAVGKLAVEAGLRLQSGALTDQEILAAVSPAVLDGALRALDEEGAELGDAAGRAGITGIVMQSSMESLGSRAQEVDGAGLQELIQSLAVTAVEALPEAGLGGEDMAAGAKAVQQGFASSIVTAGVSVGDAPGLVAAVVAASVQTFSNIVSEEYLAAVLGAAAEGAVAGVNASGIDVESDGNAAAAGIASAVVVAARDAGQSETMLLAVTQDVVQGAVKASAETRLSESGSLGAAIQQIAKTTVVALSNGASSGTLAVSASAVIAEGAVKGVGKSGMSQEKIVSGNLLEGAVKGAVDGLVAAGKSATVIAEASTSIVSKSVAAVSLVASASEGNKVTLIGALVQATVTSLGSAGVTSADAMGSAVIAISKAATVAVVGAGLSSGAVSSAASGILSGAVAGIGKAGFSSAQDVQAITAEAVKGTVSGFTEISSATMGDATKLATEVASITASGIKALGSYSTTLSQDELTTMSAKVVGTVLETLAVGGVSTSTLTTVTATVKIDATAALESSIGVTSTIAFDATITAATETASLLESGDVGLCASAFDDALEDDTLLSMLSSGATPLCKRTAATQCPKYREFSYSGSIVVIAWNGGFPDALLCSASIFGYLPAAPGQIEPSCMNANGSPCYPCMDPDGKPCSEPCTMDMDCSASADALLAIDIMSGAQGGYYSEGATIPISVNFSQPVVVTGAPRIALNVLPSLRYAEFTGVSTDGYSVFFTYVVQPGDFAEGLAPLASSALELNGGSIKTVNGVAFDGWIPPHELGFYGSIYIDTAAFVITGVDAYSSDGTFGTGAAIHVVIAFNKGINWNGGEPPSLTLETGTVDLVLPCTVHYTDISCLGYVEAGMATASLDVAGPQALAVAAPIADMAGQVLDPTLPTGSAPTSLASQSDIAIDAVRPVVLSVTSPNPGGAYGINASITIDLNLSKAVNVYTVPTLQLSNGATATYVSGTGSSTLTFEYIVQMGDADTAGLDIASSSALVMAAGDLLDNNYNELDPVLPTPGSATSLTGTNALAVDGTPPVVLDVTSTMPDGVYGAGSAIDIRVRFSESLTLGGAGSPELILSGIGTYVYFQDLSMTSLASDTMVFSYTVGAGDASADLEASALSLMGRTLQDAAGNSADFDLMNGTTLAANKSIMIDTTGPGPFSINSPTPNSTIGSAEPLISWSNPGDAVEFDISITFDPGCASPAATFTSIVGTSLQVTPGLANGVYYICVLARDGAGNMSWADNNDLPFTVDTGSWLTVNAAGEPSVRGSAAVALDASANRVVVWGGFDGSDLDTGAIYDINGDYWSIISTSPLSARTAAVAAYGSAGVFIFGGVSSASSLNADGALLTASDTWQLASSTGSPSGRFKHSVVALSGFGYAVWGGYDGTSFLGDGAIWDSSGDIWSPIDTSDPQAPQARGQHVAVSTGNKMIVWGGNAGGSALGDGAVFDPSCPGSDCWIAMSSVNAPSPRYGAAAVWTGSGLVVWGGTTNGSDSLADGAMYDPATDTWMTLNASGAPSARSNALHAYDASTQRLMVWGGTSSGSFLDDGALFEPSSNTWTVPLVSPSSAPTGRAADTGSAVAAGGKVFLFGADVYGAYYGSALFQMPQP
jgi:hypothetical protein